MTEAMRKWLALNAEIAAMFHHQTYRGMTMTEEEKEKDLNEEAVEEMEKKDSPEFEDAEQEKKDE